MADSETGDRERIIAMGQRAAASLARSVAGKPEDMVIDTNVASLLGLSQVIESLVVDANRCGGVDCLGRSIDGTKLWVTRDRLEAVERRSARLESALSAIAQVGASGGNELDMLVDWQATVTLLHKVAREALDGREAD